MMNDRKLAVIHLLNKPSPVLAKAKQYPLPLK